MKKIVKFLLLIGCCQSSLLLSQETFLEKIEIYLKKESIWQNNYFRSLAFTSCLQIGDIPLASALLKSLQGWKKDNINKLENFILQNTDIKSEANIKLLLDNPQTYISNPNTVLFSFIIINSQQAESIVENTPIDKLDKKLIEEADKIVSPESQLNFILQQSIKLLDEDSNKVLIMSSGARIVAITNEHVQKAVSSINVQIPIPSNKEFVESLKALGFDHSTIEIASFLFSNAKTDGKTYLTIAVSTGDTQALTELCNRCALHSNLSNAGIIYATMQLAFDYPLIYDFANIYYSNQFFK